MPFEPRGHRVELALDGLARQQPAVEQQLAVVGDRVLLDPARTTVGRARAPGQQRMRALRDLVVVVGERVEHGGEAPHRVEPEVRLARVDRPALDPDAVVGEAALGDRDAELGRLGHDPDVAA